MDLNLCRDKTTGKSMGFAFVAYEDQRSTNLAVDNLSGAKVAGRAIRVEHVGNYKKKKAEVGKGWVLSRGLFGLCVLHCMAGRSDAWSTCRICNDMNGIA